MTGGAHPSKRAATSVTDRAKFLAEVAIPAADVLLRVRLGATTGEPVTLSSVECDLLVRFLRTLASTPVDADGATS